MHRWIRTIPGGFADRHDHQILRTKKGTRTLPAHEMDSVRVERTPAVLQTAAATESAYCPDHPNGTRTRISTLREWLPIQLVDGARIAPTGFKPDISALKGLCPFRLDDGARMGHRGFEPRSDGLRVRYSTVILMTQDSPHRI